ncbi:hypothetical protein EOJ36_03175 [Sandaracinomonas limnophila]|uniref:Uncharacterized protein n=1 Tax=Sandaracinomonas limnophila TaxID=1862386 RepID=A0A437PXP6_9BACT|nr:DUF6132 family protein [Sandaracinomonas limnophila]RVU27013.1 hypothetical protein EOJ36_03175 [Sandaracinomonas limnophila]
MKKSNKTLLIYSIGIILGGIIGYFYWKEIGCSTGTCPITSKPLNSIIYFAFLGYLGTNFVKDKFIKS